VSLFAGCGGLDLGFSRAGFSIPYACDRDPAAVACYRHNLGPHAHVADVRDDSFLAALSALDDVDVVLGGFPCQGFSKAGPKRAADPRNDLYRRMQDAVRALSPRAFVAENVDGIQQNFGGAFVEQVRTGFQGYTVAYTILDAAAYGLPQHRRRAFFVGVRDDLDATFQWPPPTHNPPARSGEFRLSLRTDGLPPPRTVRDAIGDLIDLDPGVPDHAVTNRWPARYTHVFAAIGPGQKLCNVRNAETSVYTWQIPEAFGETSAAQRHILETIARNRRHKRYGRRPNGNPIPAPEIARLCGEADVSEDLESLRQEGYLKVVDGDYDLKGAMFCSGLFKRPRWDAPSPTVLTNFHNPRYFLHPTANRPLSLRECARLQGFPDDFGFTAAGVSLKDGHRLVGNAVPPPLAQAIAQAVRGTF